MIPHCGANTRVIARVLCAGICMLAAAAGCSPSSPSGSASSTTASSPSGPAAPAESKPVATGPTGSIHAIARFVGANPPKRVRLKLTGECQAANNNQPIGNQNFIVNANGTVQNVVVYLTRAPAGASAAQDPVVLDQKGCTYQPHVRTVTVGQKLTIRNSDPFMHNIHSFSEKQRPFNVAQPKQGMTQDETFVRPEFINVKCDVHPWMNAHIAVFDHPFHAVTDKNGDCTISGLPPGEYELGAWQEERGELPPKKVTVAAEKTIDVEFAIP